LGLFKKSGIWILLTAFAFGSMEVALKLAGDSFSALQLTFLRFLLGGILLLPFAWHDLRRRERRLTKGDIGYLAALGVLNVCFSMTLFQLSVMHSNATLAAVMISMNPIFTMVLAHFLVNEPFTRRKALLLAICMLGLFFVANPFALARGNSFVGIAMGLGSAILFSFYTTLGKKRIKSIGGLAFNAATFLFGSTVLLAAILILDEPVISGIRADNIGVLLYTSLVVTGVGYLCFMKANEVAGPSMASYAFFFKPVIAACLAALVLKEAVTWNIIVGVILILGACLYFHRPR